MNTSRYFSLFLVLAFAGSQISAMDKRPKHGCWMPEGTYGKDLPTGE